MKTSISARSPLSPTRYPADAFIWWQSLLLAVLVALAAIAGTLVFVGVYSAFNGIDTAKKLPPAFVLEAQLASYVPILLLLVTALPRLAHRSLRELGLRAPRARDVAWGVGGTIAMLIVIEAVGGIEEHLFHTKVTETAVDVLKATHGTLAVLFAIFACVLAPFVEEFVFRGFIFNAALRYVPPFAAMCVSALLFGLAHYNKESAGAVVPLAFGGLVLAFVYYRTGSLVASMITHGCFNAVSVIGLFVFKVS